MVETPELLVKPMLGFEGDGDDLWWLTLTATVQDEVGPGAMVVVPGGFDEQTTDMDVAGLGDGSPAFLEAR